MLPDTMAIPTVTTMARICGKKQAGAHTKDLRCLASPMTFPMFPYSRQFLCDRRVPCDGGVPRDSRFACYIGIPVMVAITWLEGWYGLCLRYVYQSMVVRRGLQYNAALSHAMQS